MESRESVSHEATPPASAARLEVEGLKTYFYTDAGVLPSVDGVSFSVPAGQTLGLVGESGSGKSVTALSVLGLVPSPPGRIAGGSIRLEGKELTQLTEPEMREVRGNEVSMIFQEPMTSLNPVFTVGDQIVEAITLHQALDYPAARALSIEMLKKVGIPEPEARVDTYPHEMSGGMKQRVMIAMALACRPKLLIADEPTTALDVTIQAQILHLLRELQKETAMSMLFITHDLGTVAELCDQVAVMYAGRIVEYGDVQSIFDQPTHPYTHGLFRSRPGAQASEVQHHAGSGNEKRRLAVIPGTVPRPQDFPSGCRFRTRCNLADTQCEAIPKLHELSSTHQVACHHWATAKSTFESDSEAR